MTPEQIAGLLELGKWLASGGLVAVLGFIISRLRAQNGATAAVTQGGADLVDASTGLIETLIARIESLETRVTSAEARIGTQSTEISLLRAVVTIWSNWWMDLEARWDYHRTQATPPARPVTPDIKEPS